ncbi:MAG: RidA family protein [Melioribacteraceae bacterium]|nr:RidA family protein [Melioribacteraceae bacterium]MCF8356235.1 RidA family protein [Melioribacteraceae bacterium]MCF8394994.1 RidA family protein [Melioribacteraceae bacterium]MCF8419714.1 RidA family protein [Melioribacteraceae bacterium]
MSKRENISSGTKWEMEFGYSRAVKIDNQLFISGTTAVDFDGKIVGPGDAYLQTKFILQKIAFTLRDAELTLENVVRVRIYTTNIDDSEHIGKAFAEFFKDIKPAATMIEVNRLIEDDLLVEIEADAIIK